MGIKNCPSLPTQAPSYFIIRIMIINFESLYWMKHLSFRLAVINVCPVLVPSELLLSTHLPTSEGWTAELTVGLWLVVSTTGFEPTRVGLTRFETLHRNHSAATRMKVLSTDLLDPVYPRTFGLDLDLQEYKPRFQGRTEIIMIVIANV